MDNHSQLEHKPDEIARARLRLTPNLKMALEITDNKEKQNFDSFST